MFFRRGIADQVGNDNAMTLKMMITIEQINNIII